jgi:hypothetical protein
MFDDFFPYNITIFCSLSGYSRQAGSFQLQLFDSNLANDSRHQKLTIRVSKVDDSRHQKLMIQGIKSRIKFIIKFQLIRHAGKFCCADQAVRNDVERKSSLLHQKISASTLHHHG